MSLKNKIKTQQTVIVSEFEGCTVKWVRRHGNCDVTMVVAIGLILGWQHRQQIHKFSPGTQESKCLNKIIVRWQQVK